MALKLKSAVQKLIRTHVKEEHLIIDNHELLNSQFFKFIKDTADVVLETNTESKTFYDYLKVCEDLNQTPVPPFSFINEKSLYINSYCLTKAQVCGLSSMMVKHPKYFSG